MTPLFTDFPDAAFSSKELEHILDQLWTEQIIFFPVRHHSPACAWHLMKLIQKERPCAVLVEGPESFTPLIPLILHERTRPPFAVYTQYVYESTPKFSAGEAPSQEEKKWPAVRFAAYYPFCEYSPEFVALREGQAVGARLKFIDLNYPDQVLSEIHEDDESAAPRIDSLLEERHLQHSAYLQELARRTGCRDTNDL
jgi:hypothetical protein